jgi:hypothetical protein
MAFQDMKYTLKARDQYSVCDGIITLALIEAHAIHGMLEVLSFKCEKFGHIKARVVEIAPTEMPPQLVT